MARIPESFSCPFQSVLTKSNHYPDLYQHSKLVLYVFELNINGICTFFFLACFTQYYICEIHSYCGVQLCFIFISLVC